jgi:hypothetical protein
MLFSVKKPSGCCIVYMYILLYILVLERRPPWAGSIIVKFPTCIQPVSYCAVLFSYVEPVSVDLRCNSHLVAAASANLSGETNRAFTRYLHYSHYICSTMVLQHIELSNCHLRL